MSGEPTDKRTRMGTGAPPPRTGGSGAGYPVVTPAATPPPQSGPHSQQQAQPHAQPMTMPGDLPPNLPAAGAPHYTPPPDTLLGQVLAGRYLIQKKLGEGGMGAVYLATHTVLEKQVALKVLHGEFARKADLVERFMQEAKAASRIRHQNVIDISDFGTTPDGLVFFAMELLKGHDLHEEIARARLAGRRLPWARTRPIFLQICAALSAAHAQGIVHRDLKPENIYLVEWLGHPDFVKLLDFGIAKLTEVEGGDRKLTRTGMLFGTPEYMSPEQARGEHVDHRVDVYAMGCILYQMLTGRVPFEAENFMGILSLHLTETPPPIGAPILDEVGAPRELESIVMHALEKDRDRRFQTIDEMANAIRALHGEEQVPVQKPAVPIAPTRQKTKWTGNVTLPTEDQDEYEAAPRRAGGGSKLPWVIAAVLIAGGAGAGAFFVARGKGGDAKPAAATQIDAGAVAQVTDAAVVAPVPARVTLSLSSEPGGAEIFDLTEQKPIGPAPMEFEVKGSHEPRRYRLSLKGHVTKVIELVPDQDVEYTATLRSAKGAAAAAQPEVEVVQKGARKSPRDAGKPDVGPVTQPDGDRTPDKQPDKVPDRTPDKQPDKVPDKVPDKTPDKTPDKDPDKVPDKQPDKQPDDPDEPQIKDPFGRVQGDKKTDVKVPDPSETP